MRAHKILGDYRKRAMASFRSEMCTCSVAADVVSYLVADLRSILNAHPRNRVDGPTRAGRPDAEANGVAPLLSPSQARLNWKESGQAERERITPD